MSEETTETQATHPPQGFAGIRRPIEDVKPQGEPAGFEGERQ